MAILSLLKKLFQPQPRELTQVYKTVAVAQTWTKTGNKADLIPSGFLLTVTGVTKEIRDKTMWEIASTNYAGLYIEPRFLVEFDPPVVEPDPTIHLTHTIQVYSDGSITVDGSYFPA